MIRVLLSILVVALGYFMVSSCTPEEEALPDFDKLWDYSKPAETEKKFRELIPVAEESGNQSYHAELLTQIARTLGLQQKFPEAHKTLDSVETMITDQMVVPRIRYLLERGRVYNSSGSPEAGKPLFQEAMDIALEEKQDFYAIDAIHMIQIVEPPDKQLAWAEKAIELAERATDKRAQKWLGPLYNNTGWSYFDLEQFEKAMEYFKKSLEWREEQEDEQGIRIAKWCVARTYRALGKIEEALTIQKALEKEIEDKGVNADGYVFEELGELLLVKGEKDAAKPYLKKAYDLLSKDPWLTKNEPDRIKRLKELSEQEN
jgi:tetratricopeptide (TPR) repeat protein